MKNQHLIHFWNRCKRLWFRWAEVNQHAVWFPWFIGAVVAVDAMMVLLPGDVLVVLAVLSNPMAWKRTAFSAGLGGAIGAFVFFLILRETGGEFLDSLQHLNAELGVSGSWEQARGFFKEYGLASLAIGSVLPLLSWPTVALAGLASSDAVPVAGFLILGRLTRYALLCAGVRYGWSAFHSIRDSAHKEREDSLRR